MMRAVVLATMLATAGCSFPICQNCHATINVDAATVIINTCVVVEYADGGVTPCRVADASDESANE